MSVIVDIGTSAHGAKGVNDKTQMVCARDGIDADEIYKRNKKDTLFKRVDTVKCKLLESKPDETTKDKTLDYGGIKGLTKVVKRIVKDGWMTIKTVFRDEDEAALEDIDQSLSITQKPAIVLLNLQALQHWAPQYSD